MGAIEEIVSIQEEYLKLLRAHFAAEREEYQQSGMGPGEFSAILFQRAQSGLSVEYAGTRLSSLAYKLVRLAEEVGRFWEERGDRLRKLLAKCDLLRPMFTVNFSDIRRIISPHAVYFDSLCIPCSLDLAQRGGKLVGKAGRELQVHRFSFEQYLSLLDAARAMPFTTSAAEQGAPPFIVFPMAYFADADEDTAALVGHGAPKPWATARQQTLAGRCHWLCKNLFEDVFGREYDFDSLTEVGRYFAMDKDLPSSSDTVLLYTVAFPARSLLELSGVREFQHELGGLSTADVKAGNVSSRALAMLWSLAADSLVAEETARLEACELGIERLATLPSWPTVSWMLGTDGDAIRSALRLPESAVVAHTVRRRLRWLSNLTLQQVMEIRGSKQLREVRDLFRGSRDRLGNATIANLDNVAEEIQTTVHRKLEEWYARLQGAPRETRDTLTLSGVTVLASGALGFAAIAVPELFVVGATAAAGSALLGGKGLLDIYRDWHESKEDLEELKCHPLTILADVYTASEELDGPRDS